MMENAKSLSTSLDEVVNNGSPPYANLQFRHPTMEPKGQIRILELLPPNSDRPDELCGKLIVVTISDKPVYEALSYTWGEAIFPDRLATPTGSIPITKNLAAALVQLRHPNRVRHLWVDALSINQNDDEEKGFQVALMADIYRNAETVIAWLGAATNDTARAVNFLKEIAESAADYGVDTTQPILKVTSRVGARSSKRSVSEILLNKDLKVVDDVLSRPWFKRSWIVQEAALASHLTFCIGSERFESAAFKDSASVLGLLFMAETEKSVILLQGLGWAGNIIEVRDKVRSPRKRPPGTKPYEKELWWDFVVDHCHCERRNDLDVIYALAGLKPKMDDIDLEIDYLLSIEDLSVRFAWHYLELGKLRVLNTHSAYDIPARHGGLPSWVLDLKVDTDSGFWQLDWEDGFEAATSCKPVLILDRDDMQRFGIKGVLISQVETTHLPKIIDDTPTGDRTVVKHIKQFITECEENAYGSAYQGGEGAIAALMRTLFLDGVAHKNFFSDKSSDGNDESFNSAKDMSDRWLDYEKQILNETSQSSNEMTRDIERFGDRATRYYHYDGALLRSIRAKAFLTTESGHLGTGPRYAAPGDAVVVFHGAVTPVLLRPAQSKANRSSTISITVDSGFDRAGHDWELVGECYIQGFMNNEAMQPEFKSSTRTFFIV